MAPYLQAPGYDQKTQKPGSTGYIPGKRTPEPEKGKTLGTFGTREAAEKHEREVQFFKRAQ
jgi:hypothetical protein